MSIPRDLPGHLLRAVAAQILANISMVACGLFALKLYALHLEPRAYGAVLVGMQIVGYLVLIDGGFRTVSNRRILAAEDAATRDSILRFVQTLYTFLALGFILAGAGTMSLYALTPGAAESGESFLYFLVLGATLGFVMIGWSQLRLLVGLGLQTTSFLLVALNAWISTSALWIALEQGLGLWAFPISSLSGLAVAFPTGWIAMKRVHPALRLGSLETGSEFRRVFSEQKSEALACLRNQVATTLLFSIDLVFVGFFAGSAAAAAYGILSRVIGILRGVLQSASDAAWPVVAADRRPDSPLGVALVNAGAWFFGAATGAAAATLDPFLSAYMGDAWRAGALVALMLIARFLITGVASPFAYIFHALGEFPILNRYLERELLLACLLAVPLGAMRGVEGIAAAFLISTAAGTLAPIILSYAKRIGTNGAGLFARTWIRAAVATAISWFAADGISIGPANPLAAEPLAGAIGFLAAILAAAIFAGARGASRGPNTENDNPPTLRSNAIRLIKRL